MSESNPMLNLMNRPSDSSLNIAAPGSTRGANNPPSSEEVAGGHKALDAAMEGLIKLVGRPKGDLNKKDVFDEASNMIAHGAFPTQEDKQQLIGELANLPDDEESIRKALGQFLLGLATLRDHYHNAFGAPQ